MSTWPVTLPLPSFDHDGELTSRVARTSSNESAVAQRRRFHRTGRIYDVQWKLTVTQWAIFRTFFTDTLCEGVGAFTLPLRSGADSGLVDTTVAFMGGRYSVMREDSHWLVSASLVCETPGVLSEDVLDALLALDGSLTALEDAVDALHILVHSTLPIRLY